MTSSNWYISYNNITTKASGGNVNSAYRMDFQQRITVISSNWVLSYNHLSAVSSFGSGVLARFVNVVSFHQSNWTLCSNKAIVSGSGLLPMFQFNALVGLHGSSHWDVVALVAVSKSPLAVTFFGFVGGLFINATGRFSLIECVLSGPVFNSSTSLVSGTINVSVTGLLPTTGDNWQLQAI